MCGIGHKQNVFIKKTQTTFVKEKADWYYPMCLYCGKKGHIKFACS